MNFAFCFTLILTAFALQSQGFVLNCSNNSWLAFKSAYNKTYSSVFEDTQRRLIFCENLRFIDSHNEQYRRGEVTYTMGINRFADWTHEEFLHWIQGDSDLPLTSEKQSKMSILSFASWLF